MSDGLFGFNVGQFLLLYIGLLLVAAAMSFLMTNLLRPDGIVRIVEDTNDLALLARGRRRFGEATITRMLTTGAIACNSNGIFSLIRRDLIQHGVDLAIANATPGNWKALMDAANPHAEQIESRLVANGLFMAGPLYTRLRLLLILPFMALILLGGLRLTVDISHDQSVRILAALLVLTLAFSLARYFTADRRTKAGITVLDRIKLANRRLLDAPTIDELPKAVALFGTVALVGSSYAHIHRISGQAKGGCGGGCAGGGVCGSSDDSGGGGCGGGGGD